MACTAEAACRPAIECYRPRQTTTTDASERNHTGPLGEPIIILISYILNKLLMLFIRISCTQNRDLYFAPVRGAKNNNCDQRVCMSVSVCLSVCLLISQKPHVRTWRNVLCVLTVTATWSSSDDNEIRNVLPVCGWRHVFTWWIEWSRIKHYAVSSSSPGGGTGGEAAVYDCRLVINATQEQEDRPVASNNI